MTPDITIDGVRMPTASEYNASLALLREIAATGNRGLSAWRLTTLSDHEHAAWIGICRAGLVRSRQEGSWNVLTLTAYGALYLQERAELVGKRPQ